MQLLQALLLLALACCAFAYPPPWKEAHSRASRLLNGTANTADGWVGTYFDPSSNKDFLWPRNDKGFAVVIYCYASEFVSEELAPGIEEAWDMWNRAIGEAGPDSGHALVFKEHESETNRPYCYY
jgi:hypothetical protein